MDDYYFYIFISIVLLVTVMSYSFETFKEHLDYGNYTREQTLGTFVPNNQKKDTTTYEITGKEDKVMTPDVSRILKDQIKNSDFVIIDNSAHMVQTETPRKLPCQGYSS